MPTLLDVKDLEVRFRTPEGIIYAVNGISFSLSEGETLAIVGESGCGKSVSMMSMLRLIPIPPGEIVTGEVLYGERDLVTIPDEEIEQVRGKDISMIFQDPMTSLNPVLTVGRQISETLKVHMGMDDQQARERTQTLLEWVGIPDAARRLGDYPHQFSGGMRQRVMIAMALACNPSVLIADEPTTALDVTIQAQIIDLVSRMREQMGMAIIWITHDLGVVAGMADRVIVMYAGYIVETANVESIYESPQHPYTLALLKALPRVDRDRHERLNAIRGAPPNLLVKPKGCPFAPRCEYVIDRCLTDNPPLMPVDEFHSAACWVNLSTGEPR